MIFGGAEKLYRAIIELITEYRPKAAFVYSTCIVGLIGDDVDAVCRKARYRNRHTCNSGQFGRLQRDKKRRL